MLVKGPMKTNYTCLEVQMDGTNALRLSEGLAFWCHCVSQKVRVKTVGTTDCVVTCSLLGDFNHSLYPCGPASGACA